MMIGLDYLAKFKFDKNILFMGKIFTKFSISKKLENKNKNKNTPHVICMTYFMLIL
jgi:hypothetical protein